MIDYHYKMQIAKPLRHEHFVAPDKIMVGTTMRI